MIDPLPAAPARCYSPVSTVAWQGSVAATLTALKAFAVPSGGVAVAPSIACVKTWTQPNGPLAADIRGEIGSGYVETAPGIAARIVGTISTMTIANVSATAALRGGAAGVHVGDETETAARALDRALLGVSLLWAVDPTGVIRLRPWSFASPVETLVAQFEERERVLAPIKTRRVGYQRNNRVHNDGEIAAVVLLADTDPDAAAKLGGIATGATRNLVSYAQIAPASPIDGDLWVDTSGTFAVFKLRSAGAWVTGANALASYNALSGRPVALADISTTESAKLAGIAIGATADLTFYSTLADVFALNGNRIVKAIGDGQWNGNAFTAEFFTGTAFIAGVLETSSAYIGLTDSRAASGGTTEYINVQYYSYFDGTSHHAYGDGVDLGSVAGAAGDRIMVVYDNTAIRWLRGGVTFASKPTTAGRTFYGAVAAYYVGGAASSLVFGPYSDNAFSSIGGPGTPEANADVTMLINGPPTASIPCDYTGEPKAGVLPMPLNFKLLRAATSDVTASATWAVTVVSGSAAIAMGADGALSVNGITTDAVVEVRATLNGSTRKGRVTLLRAVDAPPIGGSGGGGTSGGTTSASTSTITGTSTTTYGAANTAVLSVRTGSAGRLDFSAPLSFRRAANGTSGAAGKWQVRAVGGTFADVAAEISNVDSAVRSGSPEPANDPGSIQVTQAAIGLTANTAYEAQLLLRATPAASTTFTGSAGERWAANEASLFIVPGVYWYVFLYLYANHGAVGGAAAQIGIAQAGVSFVPQWGREWGSGRPIIDMGSRERLVSGGFGLQSGARKAGFSWTFGDLTDSERIALFALLQTAGEGGPIVVVEDLDRPPLPVLVNRAGTAIVGDAVSKTTMDNTFSASAVSAVTRSGRALVTFRPQQTTKDFIIGLDAAPTGANDGRSIGYGIRIVSNAGASAVEYGALVGPGANYAANDLFSIIYDYGLLTYSQNHGQPFRSVADIGSGTPFFLNSTFNQAGLHAAGVQLIGADGFSEGVHYGLFTRIDQYERRAPDLTKWSLSMEEWA